MEDLQTEKIKKFTRDYFRWCLQDRDDEDNNTLERYVDYRDEFPKNKIEEILKADNPRDCLADLTCEWDLSCDDWCYQDEFWKALEKFCEENSIGEYEANDYIHETFYWTYPESFLNPTFNAVVIINNGDMNYDFTKHNILNYAGDYGYCDGLEKTAGLYFLAKQQRRLTLLKKAINYPEKKTDNRFVDSCITELEEATCHMCALTFLVQMNLNTAINIIEKQKEALKNKVYNEYHPNEVKGAPLGYITLGKDTSCGLFDTWNGGGSLLEIELEKDVKLPLHLIDRINTQDRMQHAYALCEECWGDDIKDVKVA